MLKRRVAVILDGEMFQVVRKSEMAQIQVDRDMEEILSSIRQIIAEDVEENEKAKAPKFSVPSPKAEEENSVLELTNVLSEDVYKGPIERVIDRQKRLQNTQESDKEVPSQKEENKEPPLKQQESEDFISKEVIQEISQTVENLSHFVEQSKQDSQRQVTFNPAVEALARESLQPLLKAWLDQHLTKIVKDVVSEQIEKILKR